MKVVKRNSDVVDFDRKRIERAVLESIKSVSSKITEYDRGIATRIASEIESSLDGTYIDIEEIQDAVEDELMKHDLNEAAKSFILYRERRKEIREQQARLYSKSQEKIREVMSNKNIENANANVDEESFSGKNSKITSLFLKEYSLENIMSPKASKAHRNGMLYTHDLDNYASGMHNCFKRSTKFITDKGTKSFEDFNDGDIITVLTHTGEYKNAKVRCYGKQQLNKITLQRETKNIKVIEATANHRWLLKDGTFTTDLKIGDILYDAPEISEFDFDNASPMEQIYWQRGFAKGDGVIDNNWNRHKNTTEPTNRTKIRLCGNKMKYIDRFKVGNCKICSEKLENNDVIIKIYDYAKELPDINNITTKEAQAFINGLYCANGNTGDIKGIQFTGQELIDFVNNYFELAGYYITSTTDKTEQITNFGQRNDITINFSFITKKTKFSYKVKNIEKSNIEDVWCLEVEDNHTFVLSGGMVTGNCLFIDFDELFGKNDGFETRNGDVRRPNDIMTFFQLVAVAFQCQSQVQYGGVGSAKIDYEGAPYVAITFRKCFKDALIDIYEVSEEKAEEMMGNIENAYGPIIKLENETLKKWYEKEYKIAERHTIKKTKQGAESLYHNLNTLESRAGSQVPFTSINFGTDTSPEGRLVSKSLLQASLSGIGKFHKTSIFPISIFKLKSGVNKEPGTPNYDLKLLALESTSKRIYPNYVNVDISHQDIKPTCPDEENATMGCRTAIGYDVNGMGWKRSGRGNISPVTINLVALGIKHGICLGERKEADLKGFWDELNQMLMLSEKALLDRYEWIRSQKSKSGFFMYNNGTMKNTLGRKLEPDETVEECMKHGTLAMGYIGLAECMKAMFGKHHGEDDKVYKFAYRVVERIHDYAVGATNRNHLNFSCYATPAENTCYTLMNKLREQYGIIPGVTENEFITNSHHIPVYYDISIQEKIRKEGPFSKLATGGYIMYVELESTFVHNLKAVEKIIDYAMENDVAYFAINFPIDTCCECGFSSEINGNCPQCDSDLIERLRRVTGYLSTDYRHFNKGKIEEVNERVKHDTKGFDS